MVEPITIEFIIEGNLQRYTSPKGQTTISIGRTQNSVHVDIDLWRDETIVGKQLCISHSLSTWWLEPITDQVGLRLNDRATYGKSELFPGDELQIGDTVLRVFFKLNGDKSIAGKFKLKLPVHETQPPLGISEDNRIEILARISEIIALNKGQRAILQSLMDEIRCAFPASERQTIALIRDTELLPLAFYPRIRSMMSYTLARKAITEQQTIHWISEDETSDSLKGTASAIYSPIFCSGIPIGVIHVDTTSPTANFTRHDLKLLSVIANTIGSSSISNDEILSKLPRVFLSYSHLDTAECTKFAGDLRRHQIAVWYDERLKVGEEWEKQLTQAIQNIEVFVLLMTPNSVVSEYCLAEVKIALQSHRRIVPLMLRKCNLPEIISKLQYVLIEGDAYDVGSSRAIDRIRELKDDTK